MKKVLSLVLVAVLAIGMSVVGFAAPSTKVTGFKGTDTLVTAADAVGDYEFDELYAYTAQKTVLDLTKIVYEGDDADVAAGALTTKMLTKGKVTVRTRYSKGKEAIDEVKLNTKDKTVEVKFKKEHVSTKDLDFEFTVYLLFNGKGETTDGITFTGTFTNPTEEFDKDTDYIYLADKINAKATENIRGVEIELGNGVKMMDMRLTSGKKYYGTATTETTDAQEDLRVENGFNEVYTLKTVGLSTTGNYVKIDLSKSDYVYGYENGEFTFVGMGNELLPYYNEYYVSTTEKDFGGAAEEPEEPGEIEEPDDGDDGEEDLGLGGDADEVASNNANFNPGTGA